MEDEIMEAGQPTEIYALIDDIAKLFGVLVGRAIQNRKMSYGHRKLLMCLSHGEEMDQLRLIKESKLNSSSVSTELAKMETDGYVRRRFDPADQRKFLVRLTDTGMARHRLISKKSKELEEMMLNGVGAEERERLAEALRGVLGNLEGEIAVRD